MTVKEMKKQFCERIYELRSKEKLSTSELACRSGLPLEMLEALERGIVPEEMMRSDLSRGFSPPIFKMQRQLIQMSSANAHLNLLKAASHKTA